MSRHQHSGRVIRAEIRTSAPPAKAWEAWADPVKIAHWFVDRAAGEAKPGASIQWFFDRFQAEYKYQVLEAEPPRRLTLGWEPPPGWPSGVLEVTIELEGGHTVIRLVNSGFNEAADWDDQFQGVVSGWQMALSVLKHYLENYFGRPRSSFLVMKPAQFTYEQLLPYYLDPARLSHWLTQSGGIGKPGDRYELVLQEGGASGRVLAVTGREVCLSWDEIHGVLMLKAFSMGQSNHMAAIHGLRWNQEQAQTAAIEHHMDSALDRLIGVLSAGS